RFSLPSHLLEVQVHQQHLVCLAQDCAEHDAACALAHAALDAGDGDDVRLLGQLLPVHGSHG
ncbi:hypothetical protein, partial [Providencia stuartii]|uniref:hypothetical protein n=1 Tax=Providencia stuartii TaxID=588 RepID=UPI001952A3A6